MIVAYIAELQLLPFKTAEAVLLQAHRLVNLMAIMLNTPLTLNQTTTPSLFRQIFVWLFL